MAIDFAATVEVKGVILEGVFSRGRDMAKTIYPFLPVSLFADSFNNLEKIKKVRVPKLFIHSKNDEIVPFVLAQRLYNASPEPKELIELEGGHNSAFFDSKEKYVSTLALWIKKLSMRGA